MYAVYSLNDPNGEVRYIGFTGQRLGNRLVQHIHDARIFGISPKEAWIRQLLENDEKPIISCIATYEYKYEAQQYEGFWINHYLKAGADLTNSGAYASFCFDIQAVAARIQEYRHWISLSEEERAQIIKQRERISFEKIFSELFGTQLNGMDAR